MCDIDATVALPHTSARAGFERLASAAVGGSALLSVFYLFDRMLLAQNKKV